MKSATGMNDKRGLMTADLATTFQQQRKRLGPWPRQGVLGFRHHDQYRCRQKMCVNLQNARQQDRHVRSAADGSSIPFA